jgi:AsmA protein
LKALKIVLWGVGGLLLLAIIAAGIFAATFNPNRYKGEIERVAKEKTGRTLKLAGDLEMAFFPALGAKVNGLSLSERQSEREFLSLESAHGSVALMALLRGEVIVDRIRVSGLKASIIKGKDGRYNFQDLMETAEKPAPKAEEKKSAPQGEPVKFDVAGVQIEKSTIAYQDLKEGTDVTLSDLKLSTGRIAEKAAGRLELQSAVKGKKPALDLKIDVSGDYDVDLPATSYNVAKLDAKVSGSMDKQKLEARVAAPSLAITKDSAKGDAVTAEFKLAGDGRSTEATLKLGGVQGSAKALVIPTISGEVAMSAPDLPNKGFKIPLNGSARADLEKQTASAELTSKFDESNIQAKLGLAKFTPPAYLFDINVDRLNVDKYFPPKKQGAAAPAPAPAPAPGGAGKPAPQKAEADSPVDLSFLKGLNANGKLAFGALQAQNLKLANVKAEVKAANGRMDVAPHTANLYDGALSGAISLSAEGNRISLKETMTNVSVGPLLRDAAQQDRLEGRGNVNLDVTGAGGTVNAVKKSLNGTAKLNLKDGSIKGVDVGKLLEKVRSLGKSDEGSANTKDETKFTELNATFVIKNGVASNNDLDMKAPLVRLGGAGNIDIGNSRLDYLAKASVVATTKGQGGADLSKLAGLTVPVKLAGPFEDIKYQVDYGAVAAGVAKSRIGEKIQERLGGAKGGEAGKSGSSTTDRIRGLLGR